MIYFVMVFSLANNIKKDPKSVIGKAVFGAGFENNLSVGQVAQKIHLSWCCPKLSQILKKSQHLDNYHLAG